ncbi:MAG: hypothetical protein GX594_14145 [Pirellulaceae bacterium]|nr:hypothetical protein [Pirellulaceae bacterium]
MLDSSHGSIGPCRYPWDAASYKSEDGLRRAIGESQRRYTRRVNFREQWRGHLWQGRFASFVMDEPSAR